MAKKKRDRTDESGTGFRLWQDRRGGEHSMGVTPAFPFGGPPLTPPPPGAPTPPPGTPGMRQPGFWERMFGPPVPAVRPAPARPAARPAGPPAWVRPGVDPSQYFDLRGLFDYVKGVRQAAGWRPPATAVLLQVARPTRDPVQAAYEAARVFRIPEADVARHGANAWQYVVEPFVRELERALNLAKPPELPGSFRFDFAQDGSFGLAYYEP